MYKEGDRCDERITRAASIVSGCTWPLIFPNSPFSSFSSLFRDAGAGSGQWHRLVQHVPFLPSCVPIALHISSRFPPSPFSSSSTWLLLLSCPARLSTRVAIGEEKETTHRAWQIGNEEIVDGWMDGKDGRSLNGEEKDLGIWKGKDSRELKELLHSFKFNSKLKEFKKISTEMEDRLLHGVKGNTVEKERRRRIDICWTIKRWLDERRTSSMAWAGESHLFPSSHRSPSFLLFSRRRREGNDAPRITNRPMPDRFFFPSS